MPKVSVIIPTFNCAQFLTNALDSVFNQTYQDIETIIIDDGSIDDTKKIIEKFVLKYPNKFFYHYQQNSGPSAARNKGILYARGEYIAFLDADDIWLKEKLELQIKAFRATKAGLVYTDYYVEDISSGGFYVHRCHPFNRKIFKGKFLLENQISTPTLLIQRKFFEEAGLFDESLQVAEDWDLWRRLFLVTDFYHLPYPLVRVRIRTESLSSNPNKTLKNDLFFLNKIFTSPSLKYSLVTKAKAYSFRYIKAAIAFKEVNCRKEVIRCCLKAFIFFPFNLFNKKFLYLLAWGSLGKKVVFWVFKKHCP